MGILVYKHKKKLLAQEKATGITPDEPTELEKPIGYDHRLGGKWRSGITGNTGNT